MTSNIAILDGLAASQTLKTTDNAGVHTPHHNVDTVAAGENHIGAVGGNTAIIGVTFTLDTSAYASGDLLADTQAIASAVRVNTGTAVLQSLVLNDEDDQTAAAMDVVFLDANQSLGTENSAPSVSDANARNILGVVSIASTDWIDFGGVKIATKTGIGLTVRGASGSTSVYVALITRGSPTQTASGITGRFAFLQD